MVPQPFNSSNIPNSFQHCTTDRSPAPHQKGRKMRPVSLLADNFEVWMACWSWKWVPEKKNEVDLLLATKFPIPIEERVAQRITGHGLSTLPPTPPATPKSSLSRRHQYLLEQPPPRQLSSQQSPNVPPNVYFTTEYFEIKKSVRKGFGAFAVKEIEKGAIIITESPMFRARFSEVFHALEKLTKQQRLAYQTLAAFEDLAPGNKTLARFKTNRFGTSNGQGGIFFKCSRFNHACHPYATCKYFYDKEQDALVVTACRDIKKNEEITISYTTAPTNLPGDYGFFCDCPACPKPSVAKTIAKICKGAE